MTFRKTKIDISVKYAGKANGCNANVIRKARVPKEMENAVTFGQQSIKRTNYSIKKCQVEEIKFLTKIWITNDN